MTMAVKNMAYVQKPESAWTKVLKMTLPCNCSVNMALTSENFKSVRLSCF